MADMENQSARSRLQLSIRTLLELTAAIAVILAFWFVRSGWGSNRSQVIAAEGRGIIIYDPDSNKLWQFTQDSGGNGWTKFDGPRELDR